MISKATLISAYQQAKAPAVDFQKIAEAIMFCAKDGKPNARIKFASPVFSINSTQLLKQLRDNFQDLGVSYEPGNVFCFSGWADAVTKGTLDYVYHLDTQIMSPYIENIETRKLSTLISRPEREPVKSMSFDGKPLTSPLPADFAGPFQEMKKLLEEQFPDLKISFI